MDFVYEIGDRLIICLTNNEIFEGDYGGGTNDRLDIVNLVGYPDKEPLSHQCSFYRNEVESVRILNESPNEEPSTSPLKEEKKIIQVQKEEYDRLKEMTLNYIYMATMDKRYVDAISHLVGCENVGVVGLGGEFGRAKPVSLLVLSSWDQVYIFDVLLYDKKMFPCELKEILESPSIKKVVHDSRAIVDCLWHCHKVKISNIFDTQVADIVLTKKNTGVIPEKNRSISECMACYLNFPKTFVFQDKSKTSWEKRPLSDLNKIIASQCVTYLITLKNKFEELMLQNFYKVIEVYSNSLKDSSCGASQVNFKESVPEEIHKYVEKSLFL